MECGEGNVSLGIGPGHPQDGEALRISDGVVEQGRLADPRTATQGEGSAPSETRIGEQPADEGGLLLSTDEHVATVAGVCAVA